jgi:hypothetical protein
MMEAVNEVVASLEDGQKIARRARRAFDPSPPRGLSLRDFRCIASQGFGDQLNAYPHAAAWFKDHLIIGTTRSNLCMLRQSKVRTNLEQWPVECPEELYRLDMRAQIWRYAATSGWELTFQSPMIVDDDGVEVPRDIGYRGMTVFQGRSDPEPALYVATYGPVQERGGKGTHILRSLDGVAFDPVPLPEEFGGFVTSIRLLVPFKGRLFTSPAGRSLGEPNAAGLPVVFESEDPAFGGWRAASLPGFGDDANFSVFEMSAFGDYLYAGTANNRGYQIWRTAAEGTPPYDWERLIVDGAGRGPLNQAVASLCVFNDALYVGSGIQHGGHDVANKIGPAGPELVRIHSDGTWDLLVGMPRDTPRPLTPLSGYRPGFNNHFNGYFWRMAVHEKWLYVGTFNWSIMLAYSNKSKWPPPLLHAFNNIGMDAIFENMGGAELYRSQDGETWLPVTLNGFDNPYNYGVRTLLSAPIGLVVGTVNPFAPRVAKKHADGWRYEDNPRAGLEVWLGDGQASQARK